MRPLHTVNPRHTRNAADILNAKYRWNIEKDLASLRKERREDLQDLEKPLAGFCMAAASAGKLPGDPKSMPAMRAGLVTMREAADALPHGRPNIISDLVDSGGQSMVRTVASRKLKKVLLASLQARRNGTNEPETRKFQSCIPRNFESRLVGKGLDEEQVKKYADVAFSAACARYTGAGACYELSRVVTGIHSQKLGPSQGMQIFAGNRVDHMWPSISINPDPNHPDNVILDIWPQNPQHMTPITNEHGNYSKIRDKEFWPLPEAVKQFLHEDISYIEKGLSLNPAAKALVDDVQKEQKKWTGPKLEKRRDQFDLGLRMGIDLYAEAIKGVYAIPPHVLSSDFREDAKKGLAGLERADGSSPGNSPRSRPDNPYQSMYDYSHQSQPDGSPKPMPMDLRRAIWAAGGAVSRGGDVSTAKEVNKHFHFMEGAKKDILATGVARNFDFPIAQAKEVVAEHSAFINYAKGVIRTESYPPQPPTNV